MTFTHLHGDEASYTQHIHPLQPHYPRPRKNASGARGQCMEYFSREVRFDCDCAYFTVQ